MKDLIKKDTGLQMSNSVQGPTLPVGQQQGHHGDSCPVKRSTVNKRSLFFWSTAFKDINLRKIEKRKKQEG